MLTSERNPKHKRARHPRAQPQTDLSLREMIAIRNALETAYYDRKKGAWHIEVPANTVRKAIQALKELIFVETQHVYPDRTER